MMVVTIGLIRKTPILFDVCGVRIERAQVAQWIAL